MWMVGLERYLEEEKGIWDWDWGFGFSRKRRDRFMIADILIPGS